MATKTYKYSLVAIMLVISAAAAAGQGTLKPSGSFTIEVKSTAVEQLNYASRITPESNDLSERNEAILKSVAALDVIPKRWPGERALVIRAYAEIGNRLNGAHLHKNAIAFCDEAIAYSDKSPQRLVFVAAKGRALMWLNRSDEARDAFDQATTGGDFQRLSDFDKSGILIDAAFFHERQGNYRLAAQHTRTRAKYSADDLLRAEALRKALDLSLKAGDYGNARADLGDLSDAALKARMRDLKPPEQDLLRRIDAAIIEYRKKLGV